MKRFHTVRFGELEYEEQDVIFLPEGLVGLPDLRHWLLLDMDEHIAMKWLQSLDRGDFGFPVTEPYYFSDNYEVPVPAEVRRKLGMEADDQEMVVLIITTVHAGGSQVTGNLLAPLLIHPGTRLAIQMPLADATLHTQHEIDYLKFGLAVGTPAAENGDSPAEESNTAVPESTEVESNTVGI